MSHAACFFVLLGATTAIGYPQPQQPVVKTATTGVLIDVTVLDSKGRAVLDVGLDDFELTEDGKRQQIVSATLVQAGAVRSLTGSPGLNVSTAAHPSAPGSTPVAAICTPTPASATRRRRSEL